MASDSDRYQVAPPSLDLALLLPPTCKQKYKNKVFKFNFILTLLMLDRAGEDNEVKYL